MSKISIQDIASALVKKHGLSASEANKFVTAIFDVINDGLHSEKNVKIKGLGTFKVIDVRQRESVNVNTGERFVIEGHGKITFTPDPVIRDLVNKPFALFKEVELNEGVDIKMMSSLSDIEFKDDEQVDVEDTDKEVKEQERQEETPKSEEKEENHQETVQETEEIESEQTVSSEEAEQEDKDEVEQNVIEIPVKTDEEVQSELSEQEEEEYLFDDDDESWFSRNKGIVITVITILVIALLGGGYYWWHERMQGEQVAKQYVVAEIPSDTVSAKGTAGVQTEKAVQDVAKQDDEETQIVDSEDLPRQLRNAIAIVNTGAYRIVGTDMTITVNKGDDIRRISKRYFGDGMESYVMVHNGVAEVEPGMKLKIPKLEYKKKK
ncbi:MAG: HU family DNA-binding protein [Prevotella sp.]|nr:HU family DNA-binding protein [Prevotella sp.]